MRTWLCRAFVLASFAGIGALHAQYAQSAEPALELREVRSVTIPSGSSIAGAAFGWKDDLVFWTDQQPGLTVVSPTVSRLACGTVLPVSAAMDTATREYVLLSSTGEEFRFDRMGACRQTRNLMGKEPIVVAARAGTAWLLGRQKSATDPRLRLATTTLDGSRDNEYTTAWPAEFSIATTDGRSVIVSSIKAPFRSVVYSWNGTQLDRLPLELDAGLHDLAGMSSEGAIALAAVSLDRGFLQVVLELKTGKRRLLLFNAQGKPIRSVLLGDNWGLLASDPAGKRLLVSRHDQLSELVLFSWRWITSDTSPEVF